MALRIGEDTTIPSSERNVAPSNENFNEIKTTFGPGHVTTIHQRPTFNGEPIVPTNFETVLTYSHDYQFGPFPTFTPKTEDNIRRLYPEVKRRLRKIVEPVQPDPKLSNLRVSPKPTNTHRAFNTITTLHNPHVAIIDHDDVNDIFFSQRNLQTGYNNVIDDSDFHTPCRQTYIFNTMSDHIPYVLYPDNTPSTVQNKDFSGMSNVNKQYLYDMLSSETEKIDSLEGIFVVEYKEIIVPRYNGMRYSTKHLMEYYKNSVDIYPGAKFITNTPNEPNQTAGKALYNKMRTHHYYNNELNGHSIYRVVTFIPKKDLEKNIEVYVPHLGLVFGIGEIHERTVHPTYQPYIDYQRDVGIEYKNGLYIEINDPSNRHSKYYYKLGKTILEIKPTNCVDIPPGAVIRQYVNGALIKNKSCSLENMKHELGIYNNYEEAEVDGDFKTRYELLNHERKLELDKLRVENELRRINVEQTKQTAEYLKLAPLIVGGIIGIAGLISQFKK